MNPIWKLNLVKTFPTAFQAVVVVIFFAGIAVLGLALVRRRVPPQRLRDDHDVAGFIFGVVGAFYGVVLAFVIVAVWERFERANEKAHGEALALANLYNLADGFDDPFQTEMKNAVRQYTENVVDHEWQEMSVGKFRPTGDSEHQLWKLLSTYQPSSPIRQIFLDKSLDQLAALSDARRLRYVYYSEDLPSVVWIVIYVGCIITIGFSYFFGSRVFRSQAIMCGTFAALIGLTILAIGELSKPYQGSVIVSDGAFRRALNAMDRDPPRSLSGS